MRRNPVPERINPSQLRYCQHVRVSALALAVRCLVFVSNAQCDRWRLKLRTGFNGVAASARFYVCPVRYGAADRLDNQHEERTQLSIAVKLSNNLIRSKNRSNGLNLPSVHQNRRSCHPLCIRRQQKPNQIRDFFSLPKSTDPCL